MEDRVTGSRPIAETIDRPHAMAALGLEAFAARAAADATCGLNPKARLLQLCARIGYTPHVCFQR
jgi:hypothetical protein